MKKEMILKPFRIGNRVQWNWMGRAVKGKVQGVYLKPISKTFRGTVFTRNGSLTKPAYLVKSEAGSEVLKSHTELSLAKA